MSITSVDVDHDNLTMTLIADFDAPIDQVWELWSDPRKLERWWGPPGYPATVEKHDLTPGGEKLRGMWRVTAVDPPSSLEFIDAFADSEWAPIADMPTHTVRVELSEREGGTRMEMRSTFESPEDMEILVKMGMVEGLRGAAAQMDPLLA
jgi:uncharacterized protein YndB with AHSA1/START domain